MKRYLPIPFALFFALVLSTVATAASIHLKGGTIDTSQKSTAAALASPSPELLGSGYYLAALKGPVTDEDKLALTLAGAEIIEYIPDYTFLIKTWHKNISVIKKLACVDWVGAFKPEYKSDPGATTLTLSGQYLVQTFPGENADRMIKKTGAKKIRCAERNSCRVLADASQLSELVKTGAVSWIEPYTQPTLCNNAAGAITGVPSVRQSLGLYGSGQIIAIADAGLDTGNLGTISPDFAGRIMKTYALRRPGDWSDLNGHGTHTTGTLSGAGILSGSNPTTHNYGSSFAGVAPEAKIVFQSIGDSGEFVFPPLHLGELFQPAYDDGARIHSNSWGSAAFGQYTVYSNEVDQFTWDHKDFLPVFAVGNEARDINADGIIDKDSIYAPATAKNCIAVGASESNRTTGGYQMGYGQAWPNDYQSAPIKYDPVSNNINGMAAWSGRGPTDDGRIKPDLCAPGTNIISDRSQANYPAGWSPFDVNYIYWGGTSMSTPQVAGAAALAREYFQREKGINPSAALIKSALINGAIDMSPGQYGTGSVRELQPAPDTSQGWGRLDIAQSLFPTAPAETEFVDASNGLSTGGYCDYEYQVTDSSVPFKATLVWTDYPGAVHAAKELVNDLDLSVATPNGLVYPAITHTDHTNNIEQVKITNPEMGVYTVRVSGYNVPMGPQDYALSVSGSMPSTSISGTVRSSAGTGASGATITLVKGSTVKRISANANGSYVTHVSLGTYSVQVSKPGWTFNPRAKLVTVASSAVDGVDFEGSGNPGSVSGKITGAVGGVVSKIVESPHPYLNNFDQTYVITSHEGASRTRVHFAEIDLMSDGDMIQVLDSGDNVIDTFTGKGEDIWSLWADGSVIKIRMVTNDFGNIGYGFYVDGYETNLINQGAVSGVTLILTPACGTATSATDGSYSISSAPAGTYTITPSKPFWRFRPDSKTIEIPAGGSISGVDFTALPPGSITGRASAVSSEIKPFLVESAHPYPPDDDETWEIHAPAATTRMRLHFTYLSTEPGWDFVYLMDGQDNIVEIYSGDYGDTWTPWISGSVAKLELTSDDVNCEDGFVCIEYESEVVGEGLSGAVVELSPDSTAITTDSKGSFTFPEVPVGSHSVEPSAGLLCFDPSIAQVNISAGMSESLVFYVKPVILDQAPQLHMVPDGAMLTLQSVKVSGVFNGYFYVQSPDHPAGIRVQSNSHVREGQSVTITGKLTTISGERRIQAINITTL